MPLKAPHRFCLRQPARGSARLQKVPVSQATGVPFPQAHTPLPPPHLPPSRVPTGDTHTHARARAHAHGSHTCASALQQQHPAACLPLPQPTHNHNRGPLHSTARGQQHGATYHTWIRPVLYDAATSDPSGENSTCFTSPARQGQTPTTRAPPRASCVGKRGAGWGATAACWLAAPRGTATSVRCGAPTKSKHCMLAPWCWRHKRLKLVGTDIAARARAYVTTAPPAGSRREGHQTLARSPAHVVRFRVETRPSFPREESHTHTPGDRSRASCGAASAMCIGCAGPRRVCPRRGGHVACLVGFLWHALGRGEVCGHARKSVARPVARPAWLAR